MDKTIDAGFDYNKGAHDTIWNQLEGAHFPQNPRLSLVFAYLSIVLEHQHAICNLAGNGLKLRGSAFALLRSQIEAGFRGLWVNLLSSNEEIEAISKHGKEPFPKFKEMASILDDKYNVDGWMSGFADHWRALNGYTHSGLEQLGRRFQSDGNIAPTYSEEMVWELLITSGTFSIGAWIPIFRTVGFEDKAKALETWLADHPA